LEQHTKPKNGSRPELSLERWEYSDCDECRENAAKG